MEVEFTVTDDDIGSCFSIMQQLVSGISLEQFVRSVRSKEKLGYKLIFMKENGVVSCVAGIRFYEYFSIGKYLVIDDFAVHPDNHRCGLGRLMFEWIKSYAIKNECSEIQLDSGVKLLDAHKFYQEMGMSMTHQHFSIGLKA